MKNIEILMAILNFANQSFFLVKSKGAEKATFQDHKGNEHFLMTFEVDGIEQLRGFHSVLTKKPRKNIKGQP
ncbi:hypothetical protein [Bacillus sp. JCM 19034]|uniref:hypothetical protein n=1 Tax=Bacillus sp. JCM 19034 TaxID=1481928 RepID=UPI0007867370|nr:hypothetical protein [Bacillus sp. JCM 19034]